MPGLTLTRSLVHLPDPEWVLVGLAKDSSGFSDRFAVWVFTQLLCIPSDHLDLSYGDRLRRVGTKGEAWWSPADPNTAQELVASIEAQAIPFMASHRSPADLLNEAQARDSRKARTPDPNRLELIAYAAILQGQDSTARRVLDRAKASNPQGGWQQDVTARLIRLLETWIEDRNAGLSQLQAWRDQTAGALGLG